MHKKIQSPIVLLILFSMILGACSSAATEAPVIVEQPTSAPVIVEQPTAVPTEAPTLAPTEAPLDVAALFAGLMQSIPADKGYASMGAAALDKELTGATPPFLLDVREPTEVKDGFIAGAVNIPVRVVLRNLDKLPGVDAPIVVYCGSGHRGGMITAALRLLGYTNVRNLNGGFGAWKKANLAIVTGQDPAAPAAQSTAIIADEALNKLLDDFLATLPDGFYALKPAAVSEALSSATAPFLLDVRSADEWANDGYIKGAVNVDIMNLFTSLDKLPADPNTPMVVYCGGGHRGGIAMLGLQLLGYTNVSNMNGGLNGWKAANLPVVGWVNWNTTWSTFLSSLPADFYTVKSDVLAREIAEKAPFLLDVREVAEVEKDGYIAGSVNIPVREVMKNLDKLPAFDLPIVVYCGSGHRGAMLVPALRMLGWKDVRSLAGGLGAWKKASLPVETGTPAAPTAGTAPEVDTAMLKGFTAYFLSMPENFYLVKSPDLDTELKGDTKPLIIDVRGAEDFAKEYVDGSVNIPITELLVDISKLPADKAAPIVVTCASGHRGGMALVALRMIGYTNVRSLFQGLNGWKAATLPVVTK